MATGWLPIDLGRLARTSWGPRHLAAVAGASLAAGFLVRGWVEAAPAPAIATVPLKDVVIGVKQQLAAADLEEHRAGNAPMFKLQDFVFEANTVLGSGRSSDIKVLSLGSSADVNQQEIQKITIRWVAAPPPPPITLPPSTVPGQPDIDVDREKGK